MHDKHGSSPIVGPQRAFPNLGEETTGSNPRPVPSPFSLGMYPDPGSP